MATLYPTVIKTDLPLHVHRQAGPAPRVTFGLRLFQKLCVVGFFILFSFSIVIVCLAMLTKGLSSRKKTNVSLDTQDKQDAGTVAKV